MFLPEGRAFVNETMLPFCFAILDLTAWYYGFHQPCIDSLVRSAKLHPSPDIRSSAMVKSE